MRRQKADQDPESREVGPLAVEQEPPWNWASTLYPSVRLFLLYECSNSHNFTVGSGSDSHSFEQLASTGCKAENVWVVTIAREALINQPSTLVLDVGGNRSAANFKDCWGSWISHKVEYSCLFFLSLSLTPAPLGNFPAKLESVFLRYARVTLKLPDFLSVFPQLVAQIESRCHITDVKPLYELMNSYLEAKPVDCWMTGCLLSILGMLGPDSEQYRYSLDLLIATDDFLIAQLQKTNESPFKSCILRGLARCIYWNLGNFELVCQKMLVLFQQSTLSAEIEWTLRGTVQEWSVSQLERFTTMASSLPHKLKSEVIKAWMLKQTNCIGICQCLAKIYPSLTDTAEIKTHIIQVLGKIGKSMEPAETEAILSLVKEQSSGFTNILVESGLFSRFGHLTDSPVPDKIPLYSALLIADSSESTEQQIIASWLDSLSWTDSSSSWEDPFPAFIREIDAGLSRLTPQHFSKVAVKAADLLLFKIQQSRKTILRYVEHIDKMKAAEFRNIYSMKCIEQNLVGDVNTLINHQRRNKDSFVLEILVSYTLLCLRTPPTYQEVETRLIYWDDLEDSWKLLLENYEEYQTLEVAKSLVNEMTKFGISLLTKKQPIKKILDLQKKPPESLRKMMETIAQALHYTKSDLANTYHAAVEQTLKAAAKVPMQLDTLQTFIESIVPDLAERPAVLQELELVKSTYLETELVSFTFPTLLAPLLNVAEMCYYRRSELYKEHLATAKGDAALTLANVVTICTSAEQEMFKFLANCIPDIQTKPMATVVTAFNYANWKKEIAIMRKRKDWDKQLDTLYDCLEMYHSREKLIAASHLMLNMCEVIQLEDKEFKAQLVVFVRDLEELGNVTVADFMASYAGSKIGIYRVLEKTQAWRI